MVLFNYFIKLTSKTPTTKMDKGFKLYASSHIGDYEGMYVTGIMEKVKVILPDRLAMVLDLCFPAVSVVGHI